jgi:hypothetical protein
LIGKRSTAYPRETGCRRGAEPTSKTSRPSLADSGPKGSKFKVQGSKSRTKDSMNFLYSKDGAKAHEKLS